MSFQQIAVSICRKYVEENLLKRVEIILMYCQLFRTIFLIVIAQKFESSKRCSHMNLLNEISILLNRL